MAPPGLLAELFQSSSVPIDHFSYESIELLKDIAYRWQQLRKLQVAEARLSGLTRPQAEASVSQLTFDAIDVSFDAIADDEERQYFMNLPTSLRLPADAVDRLRDLGGRLLRQSPKTQELLQKFDEARQPAHGR